LKGEVGADLALVAKISNVIKNSSLIFH